MTPLQTLVPTRRVPHTRAVGQYHSSPQPADGLLLDVALAKLRALYAFSRPHTMAGTLISVCSVSLMATVRRYDVHQLGTLSASQGNVAWSTALCTPLLQALIPALLMNICIVGINQLYDVDIDRINKPYLPLASGALTMGEGRAIVAVSGAMALVMGAAWGSGPLLATLLGSLALGIAYSTDVPGLRWKRHPGVAAACILTVRSVVDWLFPLTVVLCVWLKHASIHRAVLVQFGFFLHMQTALQPALASQPPAQLLTALPPALLAFVAQLLVVSIVIALFKDVPDLAGDKQVRMVM